jgi:MYND finger/Plasmid pRiA4b ORF-3-like protein
MTPDSTESHKCHKCGEKEGEEKYQRCGRCKAVRYCSRDCQAADWSHHRSSCKPKNYLLKVHLCPDVIKDPAVTRVLSCPATARLAHLHQALQVAFQWAGTHLFEFAFHYEYRNPLSLERTVKKLSRKLRLYQVFENPQYNGNRFLPVYVLPFLTSWTTIQAAL